MNARRSHRWPQALFSALLVAAPAQVMNAASVGSGSPTYLVQLSFIDAFNRGSFSQRVIVPPARDVRALGSPGLVQEFVSKADPQVTYALVTADPALSSGPLTLQIYGDVYAYFNSLGVSVVGYPVGDTAVCPPNGLGACDYQLFSNDYALFVYSTQNTVSAHGAFYSEWTAGGGIQAYGPALALPENVTSPSGVQGTQQVFATGTIFSYPASAASPSTFGIVGAFNSAFQATGGYSHLGFPTSEAVPAGTSGLIRQTFEKGRIEASPGSDPQVLYSILSLSIDGQSQGLSLGVGASATVAAAALDTQYSIVKGRALSWSTSNGSVARVLGTGDTATIQAVGAGTANVYVSGEGQTGGPLLVHVTGTCCALGEGAPTAAISQAFQSAVDRNHLSIAPPAAPVTRLGSGYVQILAAADGSGATYIVSQADGALVAYVLAPNLSAAYLAAGGFTGPLGYPSSDLLTGGSQNFAGGAALAGSPVRVIPAPVAAKWNRLGGASGSAGQPIADALPFTSITGFQGVSQLFSAGGIFAATSGSKTGQAFFSAGPILTRYLALGGAEGVLGLPLSDLASGAIPSQTFEGGYIDLQAGAAAAVEHLNPRHPALSLSTSSVSPGGLIHLSATGFAPGATLAFTVTGQPGFAVQSATGTFRWDYIVPASALPGLVTVQVRAQGSADSAQGSYSVTSFPGLLPKLTIVSGDRQTGLPGSTLAQPLVAHLEDGDGNPLSGYPVSLSGSPGLGGTSSFVTDQNGMVTVTLRLPIAGGAAAGALTAGPRVISFSALAAAGTIQNFPAFVQTDPSGSLVAALAALLRYNQNLGNLPSPNGLASPSALDGYVSLAKAYVSAGSADRLANPWVAARFANSGLWSEDITLDHIRDLLNAGAPAAVILELQADGKAMGGAAVNATGVGPDGSILIDDPNPQFGRASLSDYLNGFAAQAGRITGTITAVLRVGVPATTIGAHPFTIASPIGASAVAYSSAGGCTSLDVNFSLSTARERFQFCDGTEPAYQLDLAQAGGAILQDLAGAGPQTIAAEEHFWSVHSEAGALAVSPRQPLITAVTDSAAFNSQIVPGELITIFGNGFATGGAAAATLNGTRIPTFSAYPYQINAMIPQGTSGATAVIEVATAAGNVSKNVSLTSVAPTLFVLGSRGAIVNEDGAINSSLQPAQRGQYITIYGTGLGAVVSQGGLQTVATPVSVSIDGVAVKPSFAGLTPGIPGLYQINALVPASLPPSLNATVAIGEAGQISNVVTFALQ